MKRKTYDVVKELLLRYPETRNSDKALMFQVWVQQGYGSESGVTFRKDEFVAGVAHPKSIIEARRKLQREQEAQLIDGSRLSAGSLLIADKVVRKYRMQIDTQKGTHVYRDEIQMW